MTLHLTREADLAAEWNLSHEQFRLLRRRHNWSHVAFSRQDVRYTDAQIEQIVIDMTSRGSTRKVTPAGSGQTELSKRRSA